MPAIIHDISVLLGQARIVQKSYETVEDSFCLHITSLFPLCPKLKLGCPSTYLISRSQEYLSACCGNYQGSWLGAQGSGDL